MFDDHLRNKHKFKRYFWMNPFELGMAFPILRHMLALGLSCVCGFVTVIALDLVLRQVGVETDARAFQKALVFSALGLWAVLYILLLRKFKEMGRVKKSGE
jgi:hypothetical protein